MEILRFGWSVLQPDGRALGFADRRVAVRTAHGLAAASLRSGGAVSIVFQDELGELTTVAPVELTPSSDLALGHCGARPARATARRRAVGRQPPPRRTLIELQARCASAIGALFAA